MPVYKILLAILMILPLSNMAQVPSKYTKEWKQIAAADKAGLVKDAKKLTNIIFALAVKANNYPQQIKAAMYLMKYNNQVEEDNQIKNILFIDTLLAQTKAPAKNILLSMQAELLDNYKAENRYKLYSNTALLTDNNKDIASWSIAKLNEQISMLYTASLLTEAVLKTTSIDSYSDIVSKGKNTRLLRPTLYDFLAHRALDYYMNTENDVASPAYKFIINDEVAFAPVEKFCAYTFTTRDTNSLYFSAIKLLQELLFFHKNDLAVSNNTADALLDVDIKRLAFVNEHGVFTNKSKLYENALLNLETINYKNEASAQAAYLRAEILLQSGDNYSPFKETISQYDKVKAKQICEATFAKYPKSEGGIHCKNLLRQIEVPALQFTTEKVNVPNQAFRVLVQYKNVQNVYCRVVKLTRNDIKKIEGNTNYEAIWPTITALPATKAWSVALPDLKDYQQHSAEIKVDGLPLGTYYLLLSLRSDFALSENIIGRITCYVSNISYINDSKNTVFVLDRDSGKPLYNAAVQAWRNVYNNSNRQYENVKGDMYNTNKDGQVQLLKQKSYENIFLQINHQGDELFTDDGYNNYYFNDYSLVKKSVKKIFLFTDRSIYRPGQTVFFKAITTETDSTGKKNKVLVNHKNTFSLLDVNGAKVASLTLTTNAYGSCNGSFVLPQGLLNGAFYISDSTTNSSHNISVEEYKRPKFAVEIAKPEGTYRVNDSIKVIGNAKAYAGFSIDGAKVTYRVVRAVRYPIWWGYYRGYNNATSEAMEITNGYTQTDANGNFAITFKALPDEAVQKSSQPTFEYKVSADITDINGETRSALTNVGVAYQALQLDILLADKVNADSLTYIGISSTNTNNIFEKVKVKLTLLKLKEPNTIFRKRYWQQPDLFVMSKQEYYKNFPYDVYANENDMANWGVESKALEQTDTTTKENKFILKAGKVAAGWYKIIATTQDKYGEEVKCEKYVQLYAALPNTMATNVVGYVQKVNEPLAFVARANTVQPNDTIAYTMATAFKKIWLIQNITRANDSNKITYPTLTEGQIMANTIAVTEADRGGIQLNYAFVQHNRFYSGEELFEVPWSNKELSITYQTYRDKMEPGSAEKWTIKIKGSKAESVAAEALVSMYDASLDQFMPHKWNPLALWANHNNSYNFYNGTFNDVNSTNEERINTAQLPQKEKSYDELIQVGWSDRYLYSRVYDAEGAVFSMTTSKEENKSNAGSKRNPSPRAIKQVQFSHPVLKLDEEVVIETEMVEDNTFTDLPNTATKSNNPLPPNITLRKNFNETAFFFPSLQTDADGSIAFAFTMPEAMTQWKIMTLAHTKELASAVATKLVVTQKQLMVQPNVPRFLREGDKIEFSAKLVNLTDKEITGVSQLELIDAATNKPIDGWFKNMYPTQYFTAAAKQSTLVKFLLDVPTNFNSTLLYKVKAYTIDTAMGADNISDGEEAAIPVLSNRMLVTESMPLNVSKVSAKNFSFTKLLQSDTAATLTHQALTVEYTSNPAWYAVQALPYLMEYPYDCAEQSFSKYYANTLAAYICNASPQIKKVFEQWAGKSNSTPSAMQAEALMSNLQKNEALKSLLLQETPWVLDAQNETQQKKNIALLFDLLKLSAEKNKTLAILKDMQTDNGGFAWFKGGRDNRYITQYIVTGIGHLLKLKAIPADEYLALKPIIDKALPYVDARLKDEYNDLIKSKVKLSGNNLSTTAIQYLYLRSFFTNTPIAPTAEKAVAYYQKQAASNWQDVSKYMQAMIALALHAKNDKVVPKRIIESLKQNSILSNEMGMYWKEFTKGGYYWYQAPIESHSLLIEAFTEIDKNQSTIDDLKTWLLKQKQTQNWGTTKATAEACYALLLNGSNWLSNDIAVQIKLGNTILNNNDSTEAGTGYFKRRIEGAKVNAAMGNITVQVANTSAKNIADSKSNMDSKNMATSWGAVYWQYFENLDKITTAQTPLAVEKKLYIEKNTDKGTVLQLVNDGDALKVGDKIKVRIQIKCDRYMEYIHMKDMRASALEPVNVISTYKYQGGLGYYESTKDASTHFFFDNIPRGTYIFEYPLLVTHNGNFSNGITTIQCMYAPEFASHSQGVRVVVE